MYSIISRNTQANNKKNIYNYFGIIERLNLLANNKFAKKYA